MAYTVKNLPTVQETWVQFLGWEDPLDLPLENGMAIHSSILAWKIPWTEKPGGLWSMGSQSQIRLSSQHKSIFFFNIRVFLKNNFIYFGCAGSSFLHRLMTSSGYSRCGEGASHCGGSSCCGAQALGRVGSVVVVPALEFGLSS